MCNPAQTTCLRCKNSKKENTSERNLYQNSEYGKSSKLIFMIKFCETFTGEINYSSGKEVDNISRLKKGLISATENTCGWTKKGMWRKQTSWCNEKGSKDISEKEDCSICGRQVVTKTNIWMQKGKHDMLSKQL